MKLFNLLIVMLLVAATSYAQSNTTESLNKKYTDSNVFFFYNNTLRMLNQTDDKDFDALIKDIEKMKLLMIKKPVSFNVKEYKSITLGYKNEAFEEIMTSRYNGKNFDVYLKEKDGKTKGVVILVNDSSNLYVLDIVGRIALDKITKLYTVLDQSSDIGQKIKSFAADNKPNHDH